MNISSIYTEFDTPAITALATQLRQISPHDARLARLVADARLSSRLSRKTCISSLECMSATALNWEKCGVLTLKHIDGSAKALFDLSNWPALQMLALNASHEEDSLSQAIAEIFLAPVIESLYALGLKEVCFDKLKIEASAAHNDPSLLVLKVRVKSTDSRWPFSFALNQIDAGLLDHLEAAIDEEKLPLNSRLNTVRLPGRALIGMQYVDLGTLRSLRCGDILINGIATTHHVLLNECPILDSINLFWGKNSNHVVCSKGTLNGPTILIKDPLMTQEAPEPEQTDAEELTEPIDLSKLDVPVRLEIDTVALTLSQLSSIRPGYVIELSTPINQANVRLTTHGQTIGLGELVAVGEQLGIRIKNMANIDDSIL